MPGNHAAETQAEAGGGNETSLDTAHRRHANGHRRLHQGGPAQMSSALQQDQHQLLEPEMMHSITASSICRVKWSNFGRVAITCAAAEGSQTGYETSEGNDCAVGCIIGHVQCTFLPSYCKSSSCTVILQRRCTDVSHQQASNVPSWKHSKAGQNMVLCRLYG